MQGCTLNVCTKNRLDSWPYDGRGLDLLSISPGINGSTIHAVRDQCGDAVAKALVDKFGGRLLAIPRKPPATGRLAKAFDAATLQRLCSALGGETIVVPIGHRSAIRRMRRRAEKMLLNGRSASDIARRVGCCLRTVYAIKAEMRAAGELPKAGDAE